MKKILFTLLIITSLTITASADTITARTPFGDYAVSNVTITNPPPRGDFYQPGVSVIMGSFQVNWDDGKTSGSFIFHYGDGVTFEDIVNILMSVFGL